MTHYHYSVALLNYLRSADQYLYRAAAYMQPDPSASTTSAANFNTGANLLKVLQELYMVIFDDLFEVRGREDIRYGCSDYLNLLCNIINTFNTRHDILYYFLVKSSWDLPELIYRARFDDLRLRLVKEKEKNGEFSSLIGSRLRYRETNTTSNNLKVTMDRYINLCEAAAAKAA
ncbi:uncharacterized protein TRAVEDRAFT_53211 [Trametes versicolor FP-101664 SS1]|uniref:uncharacterized protein n=1 Tax=Trametes versicolor (strain FP-101664) TaxID=717944 RepID=UPI00046244C8|nr:uncharacterized protein TRAVEDRAFT_53211 [Trametes versicolor FP-101664 SS1]EIW52772.1 hypothetical protein TRAVEDRAFT_53211 [Trametes versicolor FP-101664 SS1]